jgi:hypothetical protein
MSDKVKPWKGRKPRQENKKNKFPKLVPLQAGDEPDSYQEDRFPRDDFDDYYDDEGVQ